MFDVVPYTYYLLNGEGVDVPLIKSSSELQRNFSAINQLAHDTGEPIYITRNGESSLVVMDAQAFDATVDLQRRIVEHEMRIYEAVLRSEEDYAAGRGTSLEEIRRQRLEQQEGRKIA